MRPLRAKAGFTLLEALITLAVTSLTIGVLFSIGARGPMQIFRMGNRALDVADTQVARDTFRAVVGNLVVPPLVTRALAEGGLEADATDTSLTGDATTLSAQWLGERNTVCGGAGDTGRMTLTLTTANGRTVLSCQLEDGAPVSLIDLGRREVRFQYSEDGTTWNDAWQVDAGQPVTDSVNPTADQRRVYVRLGGDDGRGELVATAVSARNTTGTPF